ncbi:hypothetical protein K2X05_11550 [bacterium]|nr:hypothetical protein [bacterium]
MRISVESLPLNSILIDPKILPEAVTHSGSAYASNSIVGDHEKINEDLGFFDLCKTVKIADKNFLVSGYDCYLAIKKRFSENPTTLVECLLFSGIEVVKLKEFISRSQEILHRSRSKHIDRVIELHLLMTADANITREDLRRFRNLVGKSKSNDGKRFERDYAVASNKYFLCSVLGSDIATYPEIRFTPDNSLYTYEFCANSIFPIIGNREELIEKFHQHLGKYLAEVKSRPHPQDLDHKPIHKWSDYYNKKVILNIAKSVALGQIGKLNEPEDLKDFHFKIESVNGLLKIPQKSFNLLDGSRAGVKNVVELLFNLQSSIHFLKNSLQVVKPRAHGESIKVPLSRSTLSIDWNSSDDPKGYLRFIRRERLLLYANKQRLWRSLMLGLEHFGFNEKLTPPTTTFIRAYENFTSWLKGTFADYELKKAGLVEIKDHPLGLNYSIIKDYLKLRCSKEALSSGLSEIDFDTFTTDVFRELFRSLDQTDEDNERFIKQVSEAYQPELQKLIHTVFQDDLTDGEQDEITH